MFSWPWTAKKRVSVIYHPWTWIYFFKQRQCHPSQKKERRSPQPALVEKNAPPLWILSPPGAVICERRHCKNSVALIRLSGLNKGTSKVLEESFLKKNLFNLPLMHSPDSEFLLPIRPTKMSCISPEKKWNESNSFFLILKKNCDKSSSNWMLPLKHSLFCGDGTVSVSGENQKIILNQKEKKTA